MWEECFTFFGEWYIAGFGAAWWLHPEQTVHKIQCAERLPQNPGYV